MTEQTATSGQSSNGVARQIEQRLRSAIIAMELPPGARLSEQDIATRFAVSRQPVREALIWLSRTGLVEIQPQRGTMVVKISANRMIQARIIREQIESGVVRRACDIGLPRNQIAELRAWIDEQQNALSLGDLVSFKIADEAFHKSLADMAGLPMAWETISDIKAHLDRVCHLTLTDVASMRPLIQQHADIVDAVEKQDADKAEAAMRVHLQAILHAMPAVMENHPDHFEQ